MYDEQSLVQTKTDEIIHQWVHKASQDEIFQRRKYARYPFVRAATVMQSGRSFKASFRDISPRGFGLLHAEPLSLGESAISVWLGTKVVDVFADITWCEACEFNWWLSGGRFTTQSSFDYASLLISTISREMDRRRSGRYPFFRPFTVFADGQDRTSGGDQAWSLDISLRGLSLLTEFPLAANAVRLQTQIEGGSPLNIRGRVASCRELPNGSFVAGIEFTTLQIMELS